MDDKQQNFYKRLLINIRVKCLKQGIKISEFCLKQGRKVSDICLKQGQGMRGRAAPPHPGIYRVPPPRACYIHNTWFTISFQSAAPETRSTLAMTVVAHRVHVTINAFVSWKKGRNRAKKREVILTMKVLLWSLFTVFKYCSFQSSLEVVCEASRLRALGSPRSPLTALKLALSPIGSLFAGYFQRHLGIKHL